ncbi:hypothetical protein GMES_2390 [Paraglaciecola mesophila KMM 241]|uniref:Uncharacterized protein n=1 Tax=Paraglaciecola mesophila KMM 241 TaxID=1128912 RepID=K6ZMU4_9ALTE|nr:hypothetical protein GMES_2390 [Paraglaciecola mesophila KMM 241]
MLTPKLAADPAQICYLILLFFITLTVNFSYLIHWFIAL